ncbi:MAG: hypothetical protein WB807_03070 [Candidatus Dormiibacterota bacterium]
MAGVASDYFPGWPIGVSGGHPAERWVAGALVAHEDTAPLSLIAVEPLQPTYDHPYSAELEAIARDATIALDLAGEVGIADALKVRLSKAQRTTRFAWPFLPQLANDRDDVLARARAMRLSGATLGEIADRLGVDGRTVQRWSTAGKIVRGGAPFRSHSRDRGRNRPPDGPGRRG